MKTIIKYVAIDHKEFTSQLECENYEKLIERVNLIMAKLPMAVKEIDFSNGSGYLLHPISTIKEVRNEILELCKKYIDHNWIQQTIDDYNVDPSCVARILSDYNINPLSKAWYRFQCIDKDGKEWCQPYYVTHQDEAKQVQLN